MSNGRLERIYIKFPSAFWKEEVSSFISWIQPEYATMTNPQNWRIEAVNMAAMGKEFSSHFDLLGIRQLLGAHTELMSLVKRWLIV